MPELPEVEIIRRGLAPAMEGAAFASVTLNRADLRFAFEPGFAARLKGQRIASLTRRAKYLIAEMESGLSLAMHLGMTGRFTIARKLDGAGLASALKREHHDADEAINGPKSGTLTPGSFYYDHPADPRHDHVVFALSNGEVIRYNDPRRFGYMTLIEAAAMAEHPLFRALGVEPLSDALTPDYLAARADGKAQALKAFLLDQRVIAGLGNIYVCEALFRAGLPPDAEAGALAKGRRGKAAAARLVAAIKAVLNDALLAGGSSIRDYRHADGEGGHFQDKFDVYGRGGEPCHNACGSLVIRKAQQGRSTFFCPHCQAKI